MYATQDTLPTNNKLTVAKHAGNGANGHGTNGHGTNGHGTNGVSAVNGNSGNNGTAYKNGSAISRRDSTQVLTPLLSRETDSERKQNSHEPILPDSEVKDVPSAVAAAVALEVANSQKSTPGNTIYGSTSSNNNEWKDSVEINNLKNELLHHVKAHDSNLHQNASNNNGSLINGKNSLTVSEKYNEQDPLTGLYSTQHGVLRPTNTDDYDYDADLPAGTAEQGKRKSSSCGLFSCRPKWARKLASTHVFMVVFLLAYILQGMYMTYFVSVITTIEKLFQIKSKTTGFLLSASEMGQISTAMLLTYFAGRGHRPRWIACGMVLFSIAAFSCSLPHFIFGDQLMHSSMVTHGAGTLNQTVSIQSTHWQPDGNLCLATNSSSASATECNEDRKQEQASQSKITWIVLCIFFVSLLSSGVGQTAVATLGIPYIDVNVASKQSPMYMAITIGVRILGPASGFIVGSFCTRLFVDLSNPAFNSGDPRWIGAWWLGPVAIGSLMMLASIAMFSFPN